MLNQCTNTYLNQCTNTFLQNKHLKINVKSRNTHNADFRSKVAFPLGKRQIPLGIRRSRARTALPPQRAPCHRKWPPYRRDSALYRRLPPPAPCWQPRQRLPEFPLGYCPHTGEKGRLGSEIDSGRRQTRPWA